MSLPFAKLISIRVREEGREALMEEGDKQRCKPTLGCTALFIVAASCDEWANKLASR